MELTSCRNCNGGILEEFLSLGEMYPSAFIDKGDEVDFQKVPYYLVKCVSCGLVQLGNVFDLDKLYKEQYWYQSGLNNSMKKELANIVETAMEKVTLNADDLVVDIGCNDGTLLSFYPEWVYKLGYDPAPNLREKAEKYCDTFINDFFPTGTEKYFQQAKIITSIAMLYDLPDPNTFIREVAELLDPEGIWVIQYTDLYSMLKLNEFTNICLEHLEYYDLKVITEMLNSHGLYVYHAEYNNTNGGSTRLYVGKNRELVDSTRFILADEEAKFFARNTFTNFKSKIDKAKADFLSYLWRAKAEGKKVGMLGASTKANTFLQYCKITQDLIPFCGEINKDKYWKHTLGSDIYIIPEEELFSRKPDILFVAIWQFIDNILEKPKIKEFISNGGTVVVALPELKEYTKDVKERSVSELIDSLITTDIKCFLAQDRIMDVNLSEQERLDAAIMAQKMNARRNLFMRAIDSRLDKDFLAPSEKTYKE